MTNAPYHTRMAMNAAKEARMMELIQEISDRLETSLNADCLKAVVDLVRLGVHPDAIVATITNLS